MIWAKKYILITLIFLISSCQKSGSGNGSDDKYMHPSAKGGVPSAKTSEQPSVSSALSLTEDTVLKIGTTTVTIPVGAISVSATATLTAAGGLFANTSAITVVSEAALLKIVDSAGVDIARTAVRKDIVVTIESAIKFTSKKITALLTEDYGLAADVKAGIKQSILVKGITALDGSKIKSTFKIRNTRMAMVLADTSGGLPSEYSNFIQTPTEVTNVTAAAASPADIKLTWKADALVDGTFAVVTAVTGATLADCSTATVITAVLDAATATYSYTSPNLAEATSYTFNICGASLRTPVDFSQVVTATATTPARALAILTNAPTTATSNVQNLDVTVSGANLATYRYALILGGTTCSTATYSAETAVANHITASLPTSGAELLCVLGTIDSTNVQLVATQSAWTIDITPPVFTSLALLNDALDLYINNAEKLNATVIDGALVASGYDGFYYATAPTATACSGLTYTETSILSSSLAGLTDGVYKICVKLYDVAGNVTYNNSPTFTIDYTDPVFTSVALANDASDGYINNLEKLNTNALTAATVGTGVVTRNYVAVSSATTCDVALTYTTTIPDNTSITPDGDYKVCAQVLDIAGNLAYGSSSTITRKTTTPTIAFSSVSVGNPGSTLTPTILGAASEVSTVTLYLDASCVTGSSSASSNVIFSVPGIALTSNVNSNATTIIYGIGVDVAGNPSTCTNLVTYTHDSILPTVSSVTSSTADGSYNLGAVINVTVNFSESVTVTGTPQLTLETGGTDAVGNYVSGSPGTALIFSYTVAASENSGDLDFAATNSLALNSGTIRDVAANNGTLTLASPGAANSIGFGKAIIIDTTVPVITYTSISPVSPSTNQIPAVTLSLSEASGTSGLGLYSESGCTSSIATAVTGTSGSNVITTTSVTANALTTIYAKVTDVAGNVSTCTSMTSYTHDNTPATVASVTSTNADGSYKVGEVIPITVTFSEAVTVTGTPQITLETGGTDAVVDYVSGSTTTVLTFNYTVAASETSADLDYASTTALALNSGTIQDASLNNATLTLVAPSTSAGATIANGKAIVIDTTPPTVAFSSVSAGNPGSTLTPTILGTGSETSTVTLYYDASCVTAKSAGTANTVFASPGIAVNANVGSNTTTSIYGIAVDTALNASACTSLVTYTHDNVAPTVSSVTSTKANGSYKMGEVIGVTVTFTESVTVTGTPQITLETGGTDAVVDYTSGSPGTVLTFNYTVAASETSADLDYASTTALALNSGTIRDASLNSATLTLVSPSTSTGATIANGKAIVIDTTVPVITYTSINPTTPGSSQTPAVTLSLSQASGTSGLGLYSESGCTISIATAVTGTSGSNTVTTTSLTSDSTTTIYAKATDVAGNVSTCTSMVSYIHSAGGSLGTWSATTSTSAPSVAYYHSGVWTGSKMIVWGGSTDGTSGISTGGLYDPVTNAWTATTSTSVPTARMNHTAVWTGAHMVVWGGTTDGAYGGGLNTGAKYDPVLNSWTSTTSTSVPVARYLHVSVWTGSKMVVWGGYETSVGAKLSTGSRYDPYTNVWTATTDTSTNMSPVHDGAAGSVAVWTGSKMLFYGGILQSSGDPIGGLYDPVGDTWTATTSTSAPSRCAGVDCLGEAGVWTGSKLIVWGGSDPLDVSSAYDTGAVYDVADNSWTTTTTTGAPSARSYHSAVWTGAKMVILGGCTGASCATKLNDGFEYNPVTNAWVATTTTSLPVVSSSQTAVWTGSQMLVWGGATTSAVAVNSGGAYSPQFQTYTTGSGNFTVPTGVTSVIVEVWGAGGGGGAAGTTGSDQGAAGGGGGGYTRKTLTVSAGQTIAYVVGAGGAGNSTADDALAGTTGGLSSATYSGTTYTANGGVGGVGNMGSGVVGVGGTATNGDENRTGGSGSLKTGNIGGGGGSSAGSGSNGATAPAASATSQPGGTSPQGGGFGGYGGNTAGGSGVSPGGGGGGGGKSAVGGGGAGASGAVSFHW